MALSDYLQGSAGRGSALAPTRTTLKPTLTTAAPNAKTAAKTAVTKPVVTPDPYAAALAAQPSLATLLAQASTQANRLAQQQVNAQVAAIQQQQDQAHATAAAQSAEILKAATAAAQFLTPLGDQAAGDYTAAVQNLGGMVGGYTGGLRDTAQAAQDAAQAQLAGISGNAQTVEGHGADLANLLYGVSGSIPANALATQGLGATALARAIPQQTLSYGQQQAIGQIGEGNKTADALNTQLATARAQLPTLTQQYLKQFQDSAQNVADQAHQKLMDANTIRNTTSEIATRKQTLKQRTAAAKAKAKQDALENAPRPDKAASFDGYLRDQYGHYVTVTQNGVKYVQAAPGFHLDNTGKPVADPKPTTLADQAALAARFTSIYHYKSDWQGHALGGKITPVGGWVVSADGQSAVPPTKPGKAFIPKVDKLLSTSAKALVYIGEDGQPHFFKQADGVTNFPYDPTKSVGLQAKISGGVWVVFNPSTGVWSTAHDNNGVPLPAGTPTHFSGRYPGADGFYHIYNTTTGEDKALPTRVPATAAAAGSWVKMEDPVTHQITFYNPTTQVTQATPFKGAAQTASPGTWQTMDPDQNGNVYRINSVTNERQLIPGYHPPASGATGTYSSIKGTDGKVWRINSVTNDVVKTTIPWPTSAHGALSAEATQSYTERINAQLRAMLNGIPADPDKGTPAHPAVTSRSEAIGRLDHAGYMTRALKPLAMAILNEYYPLAGASGHNWFRVTNPALSGG